MDTLSYIHIFIIITQQTWKPMTSQQMDFEDRGGYTLLTSVFHCSVCLFVVKVI